jgi:hypothetical protein
MRRNWLANVDCGHSSLRFNVPFSMSTRDPSQDKRALSQKAGERERRTKGASIWLYGFATELERPYGK